MNKYVLPPDKPYMIVWNLVALISNLFALLIVSYEEGFVREAEYENKSLPQYLFIMEIIICIDILVTFIKAYPSNERASGYLLVFAQKLSCCKPRKRKHLERLMEESRPKWETRFNLVAKRYLTSTFITEFISIYPNVIQQIYYSATDVPRSTYQRKETYVIFSVMRLMRITKIASLNS